MDLRPYTPADHPACVALCGPFTPPAHFYVLEHEGQILGCGGFTPDGELVLGTIHPDFRRQGLGRFLLLARLRELAKLPGLTHARLQAPAGYEAFYGKQGFKPTAAPGLLQLRLNVCP
jgi:N-acetylglutamate synthase-like GNAT family acetyltransferase